MNAAVLLLSLSLAAPLDDAVDHLHHGRYDEAIEACEQATGDGADAVAFAMCVSRARIETGRYDEAAAVLEAALKEAPDSADLLGRRGELRLLRGDIDGAAADASAAIEQEPEHLAGRWVQAETLAATGKIDEASAAYRWFVRYYNRKQPTDAESLVYVAKGSLQYARWRRVNSIFHFVIRDLCPDINKAAPDDWRADAISGALLLEKYNEAQGKPDLQRALAKNPNATSVHAALAAAAYDDRDLEDAAKHADAALAINPSLAEALAVKIDLAVTDNDLESAKEWLGKAEAVTPGNQRFLAREVAVAWLDGTVDDAGVAAMLTAIGKRDAKTVPDETDIGKSVAALLERNPRPGPFLEVLGGTLERRRAYPLAVQAYETAMKVMPELSSPQISLALLSMRAGDLERARTILDAAFKADPFHVRVSNMRKVVGLLEEYESLETEHFIIRFDPADDRVLAELTAEYLEDAWPELTTEFGYEPPEKTVIELFHTGNGQSGHQWFSARMIGLPWIQTIGASTGLMIAMASPTSGQQYNWARVVRHEFTHVITLQQTDFRIPHWYTEALAVRSEGFGRPSKWNELLRERVPAGELRTLDELNAAFQRPESPDDWQFAYCQSLLYAEYCDANFGEDVHRKLLQGYTNGLSTEKAIERATGKPADAFEKGYRKHLKAIVEELGPASNDDADNDDEAVAEALKKARAALRDEDREAAISVIDAALDRKSPNATLLEALGKLKLAEDDAGAAAELFALGRKHFPHNGTWLKLHAAALLRADDDATDVKPLLEQIAVTDADDALAAKKLAELAKDADDAAATKRWSLRALYVTPDDVELHTLLAWACEKLGEKERAATAKRHAAMLEEAS